MDDFRVGSVSPYDPDHRHDPSRVVKRRREKRAEGQTLEADEIVIASEEAEAGEEPVEDYFEPSGPTKESE
jgi:hypothetical protein